MSESMIEEKDNLIIQSIYSPDPETVVSNWTEINKLIEELFPWSISICIDGSCRLYWSIQESGMDLA